MQALLEPFREMSPKSKDPAVGDALYKTVIAVLNKLEPTDAPTLVDAVQGALKTAYVRDGLMIGQFYPDCRSPGLHSPDFRPFDAPKPSLAIRHITVFDAPFMTDRDEYVLGYLARFGAEGRLRLARLIEKAQVTAPRAEAINQLLSANS